MPPSYWNDGRVALAALVDDRDLQAAGQEGRLAQALFERAEVEVERLEDVGVGQERDGRSRRVALGECRALRERGERSPARVLLREDVPVAADLDVELFGERVDDRDADAVQAAGDLVAAALAELAARVQDREDDFDGRLALLLHHADGDAAPVVDLRHRVVRVDRHRDLVAEARQSLVDRVVDELVDEVVESHHAGRADVHAGPLADRLEPLEDADVLGAVVGGAGRLRGSRSGAVFAGFLAGAVATCCQWPSDDVETPRIPGR